MNRIRELRLARGLTLEEFAPQVRIGVPHLSRLERGLRPLTEDWLRRIAEALGVAPHELLAPAPSEVALAPGKSRFVDDPQQLAILAFFDPLPFEERERAFRILQAVYDGTLKAT